MEAKFARTETFTIEAINGLKIRPALEIAELLDDMVMSRITEEEASGPVFTRIDFLFCELKEKLEDAEKMIAQVNETMREKGSQNRPAKEPRKRK